MDLIIKYLSNHLQEEVEWVAMENRRIPMSGKPHLLESRSKLPLISLGNSPCLNNGLQMLDNSHLTGSRNLLLFHLAEELALNQLEANNTLDRKLRNKLATTINRGRSQRRKSMRLLHSSSMYILMEELDLMLI